MFWRRICLFFLSLLTISIPIEHKYDKLFRFFSLTLIPPGVSLPNFFERKIYFYPSDIVAFALFLIVLFALQTPKASIRSHEGNAKLQEGIAKLASRAKFSDFFAGSIFCKVTYPVGHRHFAKNRIQRKKRKFGSEWQFAIPSQASSAIPSHGCGYLWIIFFLAALSIVLSPLAHYPLLYIRLLQLFTPIALFSILTHTCKGEEKWTSLLLGCLIFTALIQSGIAIVQYAIQGPLGLRLLSEPKEFSSFLMSQGRVWLFCTHKIIEPIQVIRPSGTFPHANVLGGFLSVSILATYSFFLSSRWRTLLALLIPILFFTMVLTFSRSALFSWGLGTLVWFTLYLFERARSQKISFASPGIRILAISLFFSLLFSFAILNEPIVHRGGIVNYNALAQGSDAQRLRYQNTALRIIRDHPFQGTGFQQLSIRALDYTANDPSSSPDSGTHNIYLYLAAETGLISLLAFLVFIVSLLWRAIHTPFNPRIASLIAMFIAFLFIGGCDFYPLLFQQGKLCFFLIAGLLAANAYPPLYQARFFLDYNEKKV